MTKKIEALINGVSAETLKAFCAAKADMSGNGAEFISVPTGGIKISSNHPDIFRKREYRRFEFVEEVGYFKHLGMFVFLVMLDRHGEYNALSERSCRRLQFDFACDILKKADWEHQHTFTDWLAVKGESVGKVWEGLFVFADAGGNFRFSYIQNVNRATDTVARRFRRFTFYVTARNDRSNRTFTERMKLPWADAAAVEKAFSVQALSDEFFAEYKRIYGRFVDFCRAAPVRAQFTGRGFTDDKTIRDYVKKLMGRLVFLQFLEKKRWLGVPEGGRWGEGDPDYLYHLFNAKKVQQAFKDNFLDKVLEPLFFDTLNAKRKDDLANPILAPEGGERVRIPYLNGGLFEKGTIDKTDIPFPDKIFEDLFDTFGRFNFTIDENGPEDAEVGVDPEMLSRIFENLLEDNKDKGAFYTPKEIVDYMCKESLIAYLGETPAVRTLVENYAANDELDEKIENDKTALLKKLAEVKICDPAIGSGAFPMGMLAILARLRLRLEGKEESSANIVALKKDIIQKNIYGVDIEAGAVDIARLRFWLSIVVDEENPIPLPNLDYKIMQGNSLLESFMGVDLSKINPGEETVLVKKSPRAKGKLVTRRVAIPTERKLDLFGEEKTREEIFDAIAAIYNETDHKKRDEYRALIYKTVGKLIAQAVDAADGIPVAKREEIKAKAKEIRRDNAPFMLWHLFFADAFKDGGFDIVIGNPPYFNIQTLGARSPYAEAVRDAYPEIWQDKSDILFYFFALALCLSKDVIMYITSNAYPYSDKAQKLRNAMLNDGRLRKIVNFERYNIFNSASITTCITLFDNRERPFIAVNHTDPEGSLQRVIEYIKNGDNAYKVSLKNDQVFALVNSATADINEHIDGRHKILRDIVKVGKGMETAANGVFCFPEYPSAFPHKYVKRRMCGEIIGKYVISPGEEYILYFEDVDDITLLPKSIQKHLEKNRETLEMRATVRNEGRPWWRYSRPMHKEYYHLNKIWCSYRAKENIFALDESTDFIGLTNTTVIFDTNPKYQFKYILALLNSKLLNFRYRSIGKQTGGGIYEYFENGVGKLPIPEASSQKQNAFVELIDQILSAKKQDSNADTSALESQIDDLVYDLYGLTEEERKIVDPARFGAAQEEPKSKVEVENVESGCGCGAAGVRALPEDDGDDARD